MGSPVRQHYRAKDKPKSKSKAAPKEKKEKKERKSRAKAAPKEKKQMEVTKDNMLARKKRKAAAEELAAAAEVDASAPKATKRARTMQTKAAAMAETSSSGTPLMNKIENLLKHVDEQDACVADLVDDEDVNQFLSRTYSDVLGVFSASMSGAPLTPLTEEVDSDFEVVDIPDTPPPPTRSRTAPSRRPSLAPSSSASASASPPRAEGDHFGKVWGPWALEARDRTARRGSFPEEFSQNSSHFREVISVAPRINQG